MRIGIPWSGPRSLPDDARSESSCAAVDRAPGMSTSMMAWSSVLTSAMRERYRDVSSWLVRVPASSSEASSVMDISESERVGDAVDGRARAWFMSSAALNRYVMSLLHVVAMAMMKGGEWWLDIGEGREDGPIRRCCFQIYN